MLDFIEKPGFVIVLLVALVVFGSKRLPDSARALGRSMRILKSEAKGLRDDDKPSTPGVETQALPASTTQPASPVAEHTQQHQP
ncbi:MAG: twin-arginine translocation protein TatA/E family [Frankiales bacterium]|nr:twin-arginine translocation protein TatA/E family [Frankiales bacterium]